MKFLTTDKSTSYLLEKGACWLGVCLSVVLFNLLLGISTASAHGGIINSDNNETFQSIDANPSDVNPDDALMSFQRTILMSRHHRSSQSAVTTENVVTYPIPGAELIPHITASTPVPMSYILNHSVNIPHNAEAREVGVSGGVIILSPGR